MLIFVTFHYRALTGYLAHSLHVIKQQACFNRGTGNQIIQWIQLYEMLGNHMPTRDLHLERFARNILTKSL